MAADDPEERVPRGDAPAGTLLGEPKRRGGARASRDETTGAERPDDATRRTRFRHQDPHEPTSDVERNTDAQRREQFERVVLPHLEEAFVFARALTGNPTDAQDIVQDASLNAYRAISGYAHG